MMDTDQNETIEVIPIPPSQHAEDFKALEERLLREMTEHMGIKRNDRD